jgi:uncharacterized Ntn-hydrolase superfamily protein
VTYSIVARDPEAGQLGVAVQSHWFAVGAIVPWAEPGVGAVATGESCIPFAGHVIGEGVSCQANLMTSERVWPSMLDAFASAQGTLSMRLLAALDAAELAGGDIRGRQSSAILVVPPTGEHWESVVSLRVEDDPEPLAELRRLVTLRDAYAIAGRADELINEGRRGCAVGSRGPRTARAGAPLAALRYGSAP